VSGRSVETLVSTKDSLQGEIPAHNMWTLWLDPANGLWVKSDYHWFYGEYRTLNAPYLDRRVTLP
jgi:hypothetical protein